MVIEQQQVKGYLDTVVNCMIERLELNRADVLDHLTQDKSYIDEMFSEYADVFLHDDPMRTAISFAKRWNLIEPAPLVIKRPQ